MWDVIRRHPAGRTEVVEVLDGRAAARPVLDVEIAAAHVNGFAPGVGRQELESMRETLAEKSLQRIVRGVPHRQSREDAGKNRNAVEWAANSGARLTEGRGVFAQTDKPDGIGIGAGHAGD